MIYLLIILCSLIPVSALFAAFMILTDRWTLEFDHLPDYEEIDLPYLLRKQAD